jgi:hypothetical protein
VKSAGASSSAPRPSLYAGTARPDHGRQAGLLLRAEGH